MTGGVATGALTKRSGAGAPGWWPAEWYYGWALTWTLGFTAIVSYGVLQYAFAAFLAPMGAELGWSKTAITGAFSLALLVAGLAAIPLGHWVDHHGPRAVMTAGSMLATMLLLAWAHVTTLESFYAIWSLMGVAMAAVFYEPAFVVIATWFRSDRRRALTILTFLGGFASVLFVPLATMLVAREGWRAALVALAAILGTFTILPHALVLRRRPADFGLAPDGMAPRPTAASGTPAGRSDVVRQVLGTRAFRWTSVAFMCSALTTTAVAVHLVPLLLERGYGAAFAGGAMGVLGLMALPGRLIFTPLGGRWSPNAVTAWIFALQGLAVTVLLTVPGTPGVWIFVVLFGAGFGAITPARAALVGDLVPVEAYGRVSGVLALGVAVARAGAPVGASVLYACAGGARHGYRGVLVGLLLLCVASGVAVLRARHGAQDAQRPHLA